MADRNALGLIGLMLFAATFLVATVGAVLVNDHLSGRLHFDDAIAVVSQPAAVR
jgi:hypothetical protein